MLEGKKVSKNFGGLSALKDVDFQVAKGQIFGLIGPNGSGKTTLFNVITGFYPLSSGEIFLNSEKISGLKPHKICRKGISRTFQIVRPFLNMSVLENVVVGGLYGRSTKAGLQAVKEDALRFIEMMELSQQRDKLVRDLTLFHRKRVEIATALNANPSLLLLDEPLAGLNPSETTHAVNLFEKIRDDMGVTIFWIEHIMRAIMQHTERIMVLHHGEKIAEGTPAEIAQNPRVIDAYLGEKYLI